MFAAARTVIALVILALTSSASFADTKRAAYSAAGFAEAQAAGKTIVVDVYADWCPTCKAQKPILDELASEKALSGALFVSVDFDREKDFLRTHRVPRQSTILVFKGAKETGRSVAETNRDRLRTMVLSAAGS